MSPRRYTLAVAALALLLLTAALPVTAADDGTANCKTYNSYNMACSISPKMECSGCLVCNTGYYLVQTYDVASGYYNGTCVQDSTSTEGCANITTVPVLLSNASYIFNYGLNCLSCKSGYAYTEHTYISLGAYPQGYQETHYGMCVSKDAGSGPVSILLMAVSMLVTVLYTVA